MEGLWLGAESNRRHEGFQRYVSLVEIFERELNAVQAPAEQLLMDVVKLEAEKAEKAAKTLLGCAGRRGPLGATLLVGFSSD